jgi:hypothetical protein
MTEDLQGGNKTVKKINSLLATALLGIVVGGVPARGEDPTAKNALGGPKVSMVELAKAVQKYLTEDSALKGGYFLVYDPVQKKAIQLTLDKVHHDRVVRIHKGIHFACAEFKGADGGVYDLDIFMKGTDASSFQITEVAIHKMNDQPRYGWVEERQ